MDLSRKGESGSKCQMHRSGSTETQESSSSQEDSSIQYSPSSDQPEWTAISFQRQASIRKSQKELPQFIKDMSNDDLNLIFPVSVLFPTMQTTNDTDNKDEREDMQEKTFRKWVNVHLEKAKCPPITDLFRDLRDGTKLLTLLQILTGSKLPREKGKTRVHAINNINRAIQCLRDQNVKIVNINSNEIVDGNSKITLGLIWSIIQQHWKIFAEDQALDYGELALQDVLMRWCHYSTQGYNEVSVTNFTSSWVDGLAFNALLHKYHGDLINMDDVRRMQPDHRLTHAFEFAQKHIGVQKLLDIEDLSSDKIDRKSVMTYLLVLFQALPHDLLSSEAGINVSPPQITNVSVEATDTSKPLSPIQTSSPLPEHLNGASSMSVKDYQSCLEEVLSWLLEAEDKLACFEDVVETEVEVAKRQFKEHEEFMLALTQSQGNVGDALHSGQAIIDSGKVTATDKEITDKQMTLVNDKWEALRQGAMERQARLQECLMSLQETQLKQMKEWLDGMEKKIDASEALATEPDIVKKQIVSHADFQREIEEHQAVVTSLSTFVAVVDESTQAEQSYEQLEETLQDIGKRWMVVCQWAEKRANRLNGLVESLIQINKEQKHFGDWLDMREAALGSLKSAHHLTCSKQVMEQVNNLQSMEKNLEEEHPRFVRLSQLSSQVVSKIELENAVGANNIRRKLDEITQRWDNLVVRMEEHSRMLVRTGKINENQLKNLLRSPKCTSSSTVVTSANVVKRTTTTTTVIKVANTTNEEAAKRLKLDEPLDLDASLEKMCAWLADTEATLAVLGDTVAPSTINATIKKVEEDIMKKTGDLESLVNLGHELLEKCRNDDRDTEDLETKLRDVNCRWRDVNLALADIKRAVEGAAKAETFEHKLSQVDQAIIELSNWTETFDPKAVSDIANVRIALRQCQEKLELVRQKEAVVDLLQQELEHLTELGTTPEIVNAQRDFERFTARWERVVERLSFSLETLTGVLHNAPEPTLRETVNSLNEWLTSAENVLETESLNLLDHIDVNNTKIERVKELQAQKMVHSESMHYIQKANQDSEVTSEEIEKIHRRWDAIDRSTNDCLSSLEKGVNQLNEWDKSASELDSWFDQVTDFVHSEQPAHGQLDTLREQLDQSQGLLSDTETLRPKLQQMSLSVKEMTSRSTPVLADYLATRMDAIETRWDDVERLAKAKHASLMDAQQRSSKVFEDIEELSKFLSKLDAELSIPLEPNTGKDLQVAIKRHKQIRDQLESRSGMVDQAVNLAEELTASLEGSPDANVALREQLQLTRTLWDAMGSHVRERLQRLTVGFENWKELQELLAGERVCLDQLDRKLHEPIASVADAEEFSEQLDLLERLMEGSGSRARILGVCQQLCDANLLNSAVQAELAKYDARRQELMDPAKERQSLLECGVTESQEVEQQLLNCQSWIAHVDYILSSRLDTDILASDVPEEYKQLQQEFDEHTVCLGALTEQVELYAKQGRTEAALRLFDQLNHIKNQLSELQQKFAEFKRPRDFEQRLERVGRILQDVETGLVLLTPSGYSSADCHVQLDRCQEVQSAVHELGSEIEDLSSTADKLIQEGTVESKQSITGKLEFIKDHHRKLQQIVSEAEEKISRGRSVLMKWEAEQKELVYFLTESEREIGRWEANDPSSNIADDLQFIEKIASDLLRRESSWAVLDECLEGWQKVAVPAAAEGLALRLQALRHRWQELQNTLSKWRHSLTNMEKDNAVLMNDFETSANQVQGVLQKQEDQLAVIKKQLNTAGFSSDLVEKLKRILYESNEARPQMDTMRDLAVELMGRGEECQAKVQPHLAHLNARWATVDNTLKDLQKQLIGSSPSPAVITPPPVKPPPEISISEPAEPPNDENIVPAVAEEYEVATTKPASIVITSLDYSQDRDREDRSSPLDEAEAALTAAILGDSDMARKMDLSVLGLNKIKEMMERREFKQPTSIPMWSSESKEVTGALEEVRPTVLEVISDGKALASSGSMELHVHHTLENIDRISANMKDIDKELKEDAALLAPLSNLFNQFQSDQTILLSWIDQKLHKLSEIPLRPEQLQATQDEYSGKKADYENLRGRSKEMIERLRAVKPRSDVDDSDTDTDKLREKWSTLEARIKSAELQRVQAIATSQVAQAVQDLERSLTSVQARLDSEDTALGKALYGNFSEQEDLLKAVDENLGAVDVMIEKLNEANKPSHPAEIPSPEQERLQMQLAGLKAQLITLKETHNRHKRDYEYRLTVWQGFHTDLQILMQFLDGSDETMEEWRKRNGSMKLEEMEKLQLQMENVIDENEKILHRVSKQATTIVPAISQPEKELMKDKLDVLGSRWRKLASSMAERRQKIDDMHADDTEVRDDVDELGFWCDESEMLLQTHVDPSNLPALQDITQRMQFKCSEIATRTNQLKIADRAKNKLIELKNVPLNTKHKLRQDVAELQSRMSKLRPELEAHHLSLAQKLERCGKFWGQVGSLTKWVEHTNKALDEFHAAVIYTPTQLDPSKLDSELRERQETIDEISVAFNQMKLEAKLDCETGDVSPEAAEAMSELMQSWARVLSLASSITTSSSSGSERESSTAPSDAMVSSVVEVKKSNVNNANAVYAEVNKAEKVMQTSSTDAVKSESTSVHKMSTKSPSRERKALKEVDKYVLDDEEEWSTPPPNAQGSNLRQDEQTRQLVQLRHWLTDGQRELGGPVDLINLQAIKDTSRAQQAFLDQLQTRRLGLIGILESAIDEQVRHRAEVLSRGWERVVSAANKRKRQLGQLMEDCRGWDALKSELELWLSEGQSRCTSGPKVSECNVDELKMELAVVDALLTQLDEHKLKMTKLNQYSNQLLDVNPQDDASALTQTTSELNTLWSKFNDNIRIRRAVLEASLRSRKDLHTALKEFDSWLSAMQTNVRVLDQDTSNTQMIKDAQKRKSWMDKEKEVRLETEAHEDVLKSLQEMGSKLAVSLEKDDDKLKLENKLKQLDQRWHQMVDESQIIRVRLESAQEQWERLTNNLKELIYWTETKEKDLYDQQPVGGDMGRVTEQKNFVEDLMEEMKRKDADFKETVQLAHAFLLQQDTRPYSLNVDQDQQSSQSIMERQTRRIAHQIKVEADTLGEKWKELADKAERWYKIVHDAQNKMGDFDKAVEACEECVKDCELTRREWRPVKDIQLDDLPNQMTKTKSFRHKLVRARDLVDDVNDRGSRLLADNIQMSSQSTRVLDTLNTRYKHLDHGCIQRMATLENALKDFGPSSQHFLLGSVIPPWERSVAANRVPYYVNHDTEKTQWDHPKMSDMMLKLCDFNDVKFSAYRTGMKLRALQKKLCLDLVSLDDLHAVFVKQQLVKANDSSVDVSDIVMSLLPLYEQAQANYPELLQSLPLAIDLCLNTLLNIYDPPRLGTIRVLSFKVALVALCRAQLEQKYKYLFNLVSSNGTGVDQKKMALLLYDSIQIPKLLGESAVFGGSNVEPSVRSCFERVKFPLEVKMDDYLDWLKQEPQSLVWLPVMHRVAAAETAKHQAKCNVCKMFPIVGLRYRCLKCFNFDVCQNCFFSQRIAKGHKVTHPMQEYCIASTSGEDVRDFSRVVRNKLKTKSHFRKHPRLGYLPVDSVNEGAPLEAQSSTPSNANTQHLHSRLEQLSERLNGMDKSMSLSTGRSDFNTTEEGDMGFGTLPSTNGRTGTVGDEHRAIATLSSSLIASPNSNDETLSPVMGRPPIPPIGTPRSPAQIVCQIDHMQKEELDQVLKQLEDENKCLQEEYESLRHNVGNESHVTSNGSIHPLTNGSLGRNVTHHTQYWNTSDGSPMIPPTPITARSMGSLPRVMHTFPTDGEPTEEDLLLEARGLRLHKDRLEERSRVLEDHNTQLEIQLARLKHLIQEQNSGSGGMVNGIGSPLSLQSTPLQSAQSTLRREFHITSGGITSAEETDSSQQDQTGRRIGTLMTTAEELGKAMGSLVNAVTSDDELSDDDRHY